MIQIIHDELNDRGLKTKHLAQCLGLSESQLSHKLQNFCFFSAIELAKIRRILKLKPSLIFKAIEEGEKFAKEGDENEYKTIYELRNRPLKIPLAVIKNRCIGDAE